MMDPRVLISVATYNERENLSALITAIHEQVPSADVLVVDDNSPDGTGQIADEIAAGDPRVHVLHRPGKLGLGTAILAAMCYAMEHGYDYLVNMDADFSHHPRYLPALLNGMKPRRRPGKAGKGPIVEAVERCDVMIGSRYVRGGGVKNWPLGRRLSSRAVNGLARLLLRIPARDTSGGYRCYRVKKLATVDLNAIRSQGYSFQQEMLHRCRQAGCQIGETPILFEDRRAGQSKVNWKEMVESLSVILALGVRTLFGRD